MTVKQKIICIGGGYSGCGKTTTAEVLLRHLKGRWGALKYTKTAFYCTVVDETDSAPPDKDTGRLLRAGAKRVVRIQSPPEALEETVSLALQILSDCDGIVAEGNSLVEFLPADIVIFVSGRDPERLKPSATEIREMAHIVVEPSTDEAELLKEVLTRIKDV